MDGLEILIPIVALLIGGLIFLVPLAAFSLRFAAKPVVEAVLRMKEAQGGSEAVGIVKQRLELVEQRLDALEGTVDRISDAADFQRRLGSSDE